MTSYVVQWTTTHPRADQPDHTIVSYWYGPKHGWGTTWGSRADSAVRVFSSKAAAENAIRSVCGSLAAQKRRGVVVVPA